MPPKRKPVILYHATPSGNMRYIGKDGLQPFTMTRGGQGRLYAVESHRIEWLIEHVEKRHKVAATEIVVIQFATVQPWIQYNRGIWYSLYPVPPFDFMGTWRASDGLI